MKNARHGARATYTTSHPSRRPTAAAAPPPTPHTRPRHQKPKTPPSIISMKKIRHASRALTLLSRRA